MAAEGIVPRGNERTLRISVAVLMAATVGVIVPSVVSRARQRTRLERDAVRAAAEPVRVVVVRPQAPAREHSLALPGTVEALRQVVLFARTSGYLRQRLVDIGDRVTVGQLLAVIETPELDQQLEQARANRDRDARSLDVGSRTLLTEVQAPNADGALLPGMYAQVALQLARPHPWLLLDASALLLSASGPQVAVLGPDGRIHLRPVAIDVDFGPELAISQGISAADRVILDLDSRLKEGTPAQAAR